MSDFRGETIYFLLVDRFSVGKYARGPSADVDTSRTDWHRYWGGNLRGVVDQLDYLKALGAGAIWLSPVFEQVDGATVNGVHISPYHGYWAKDLRRLDPHLVDRPEDVRVLSRSDTLFDELVEQAHERGLRIVLDVVCNHSNPHTAGGRSELYDDGEVLATWDAARGAWTQKGEDFEEETPAYRRYIRDVLSAWVGKGVDALRVDAVKSLPLWFWQELSSDLLARRPGLFVFGEWFQGGSLDPASVEFANKSGMAMLDFAWRTALVDCLAHRSPRGFEQVQEVVERDVAISDPSMLVTFVDNLDLPRFLSLSNDVARFRLAILLTLVARGIPCLLYGNEQLLHDDHNRGNEPYNRPMMPGFELGDFAREIAALAALRKQCPALQRGGMRKKWLEADKYAFTRAWLGSYALVAVNRSNQEASLGLTGVELPDGVYDDALGGLPIEVLEGATRVTVPPRGIVVYAVSTPLPTGRVVVDLQVHGIRTDWGEELHVYGDAPELGEWDVEKGVRMEYINANSWGTTLAFGASAGKDIRYKFAIKRRNGWAREPGQLHERHVPRDGVRIWRETWRV